MSYVTSYYHVVFGTFERHQTINREHSDDLYAVIGSQINQLHSKALIINGVQDHIHILLSLSPMVALSDLMRNVKSQSSVWAKASGFFPHFKGWSKEYGAFSLSASHKDAVYKYIEQQREHHLVATTEAEFERLVTKAGLQFFRDDY